MNPFEPFLLAFRDGEIPGLNGFGTPSIERCCFANGGCPCYQLVANNSLRTSPSPAMG